MLWKSGGLIIKAQAAWLGSLSAFRSGYITRERYFPMVTAGLVPNSSPLLTEKNARTRVPFFRMAFFSALVFHQ